MKLADNQAVTTAMLRLQQRNGQVPPWLTQVLSRKHKDFMRVFDALPVAERIQFIKQTEREPLAQTSPAYFRRMATFVSGTLRKERREETAPGLTYSDAVLVRLLQSTTLTQALTQKVKETQALTQKVKDVIQEKRAAQHERELWFAALVEHVRFGVREPDAAPPMRLLRMAQRAQRALEAMDAMPRYRDLALSSHEEVRMLADNVTYVRRLPGDELLETLQTSCDAVEGILSDAGYAGFTEILEHYNKWGMRALGTTHSKEGVLLA